MLERYLDPNTPALCEFASGKLAVDLRSTTTLWQFAATAVADFERIVLDE